MKINLWQKEFVHEQGIAMVLLLYALSMNTSPIGLAITGVFGGEEKPCCFWDVFTKRQKKLEKMVEQASRCLKNTCWKGY